MDYHQSMVRPRIPDIIVFLAYAGAIALSAIAASSSAGSILEVNADGKEYAYSLLPMPEWNMHEIRMVQHTVLPAEQGNCCKLVRRRCRCGIRLR